MAAFVNLDLCRACGGKCCKQMPGAAFPEDFPNLEDDLRSALQSGLWAIDWWEGGLDGDEDDGRDYFIRPAVRGPSALLDLTWGGECVLLTATGCSLALETRPRSCRLLEPRAPGPPNCEAHMDGHPNSKHAAAVAWRQHATLVSRLIEELSA